LSRFSRGCELSGREEVWLEVTGTTEGPTPARNVSWIPGAEGAPREVGWRWEWVVAWPEGGAILIACERLVDVL
jgi:hypothetical protein